MLNSNVTKINTCRKTKCGDATATVAVGVKPALKTENRQTALKMCDSYIQQVNS
jgi:hypothetical protein